MGQSKKQVYALVQDHEPLVKNMARYLLRRVSAAISVEDLSQAGMIGLLEAATQFDAQKGASFETYARIRIRGSMLDEIRRGDWAPRSVYRNMRRLSRAMRIIENQEGRDARHREVADYLALSLKEHHQLLQDAHNVRLCGFHDLGIEEQVKNISAGSAIPNLADILEQAQYQSYLSKALKILSEREQEVLRLYYQEELNLKAVGQILGVSESRVSQIHSQSVLKLQTRLKDWGIDAAH
jgi:RNA polymerase sigma factor for flagellar operon FliA